VNPADPATKTTYETNLAQGRTEDQAVIDNMLTTAGAAVILVPSGSSLVGVADRAGYPVLTIPAGFGLQDSSTGGDPIGVDLIGTKESEAALLEAGYALEQGLQARKTGPAYMKVGNPHISGVPSETNQSMFRCVVGSEYYSVSRHWRSPMNSTRPRPGAARRPGRALRGRARRRPRRRPS